MTVSSLKLEHTSTVYVISNNRILLHFHEKHQKWLPPGGHAHADELPTDAAIREVFEETGLSVKLIEKENLYIDFPHAKSVIRPYLCLLENIPEHGDREKHQHLDHIYLAEPLDDNTPHPEFSWVSLEEIKKFKVGINIFADTVEVAKLILD